MRDGRYKGWQISQAEKSVRHFRTFLRQHTGSKRIETADEDLARAEEVLQLRHYSPRTAKSYLLRLIPLHARKRFRE